MIVNMSMRMESVLAGLGRNAAEEQSGLLGRVLDVGDVFKEGLHTYSKQRK